MNWYKSVKYYTEIELDGKTYGILCEKSGDVFELSINNEYVGDLFDLPEREEVIKYIKDNEKLNGETLLRFPRFK